jgi:RNA polymerase sigma-70 factor, ECF subfamily
VTDVGARNDAGSALSACFRDEWPKLVAAAARITGDLSVAEEVVQDAMAGALSRWPFAGVPDRPGAWLLTATRNRAINHVRDESRRATRIQAIFVLAEQDEEPAPDVGIIDDRLRLMFTCCHPVLSPEAQAALTLRMVCGLSVREIARAFLQPEATIAQRISRAKRTLNESNVGFETPPEGEWPERLPAVLSVVYLVFNEGYAPAEGPSAQRDDLCDEALRLGRLLTSVVPKEGEVHGLLSLMELHASRRATRVDDGGDLVLLPDQDRSLWDRPAIAAGVAALECARGLGESGPLTLQAEIAACHALAATWEETDWAAIVGLYDRLLAVTASPVVALNRAVAVAMRDGAEAGLAEMAHLFEDPTLHEYHLLWAARADLWRRCGRFSEAERDYQKAIELATNPADRRFLAGRLEQCRSDRAS